QSRNVSRIIRSDSASSSRRAGKGNTRSSRISPRNTPLVKDGYKSGFARCGASAACGAEVLVSVAVTGVSPDASGLKIPRKHPNGRQGKCVALVGTASYRKVSPRHLADATMKTTNFRRTLARFTIALALSLTVVPTTNAQGIPERLADSTFWRLMNDYSEPWGVFRSENFVSNETSLQWVIPELQRTVKPGGVYMGVAPDQNFTYILAAKPSIAFIVDIRHQNAVQHLMYKALMEMSNTRAEFLAKLFARPALAGVDTAATVTQLFDALANTKPDSQLYRANLQAIMNRLTKVHHFALSDSDVVSMRCVYGAFLTYGPAHSYNHSSDRRKPDPFEFGRGGRPNGGGGGGAMMGGFGMPAFLGMLVETDGAGINHSYLATEANYRALKNMEERNLIVPLTGNFAGEKAVRAAGQYARDHGATV